MPRPYVFPSLANSPRRYPWPMTTQRIEPGPGQESVWDYPRPPALENSAKHIEVRFNGVTIADTRRAKRILETSHPPVYYIPPDDVRMEFLHENPRATW